MSRRYLLPLIVALAALSSFIVYKLVINRPLVSANYVLVTPTPKPMTEDDLLVEFNNYRVAHNLKPVVYEKKLCEIADVRAEEIKTDWSHNGFVPKTVDLTNKYKIKEYEIGENLAKSFISADQVIYAWDTSPTHKENMVNPVYQSVCFAISNNGIFNFVVQELGSFK